MKHIRSTVIALAAAAMSLTTVSCGSRSGASSLNDKIAAEGEAEAIADSKADSVLACKGVDHVTHYAGDGEIHPDPNRPVIIDFNATWCGPCRMFSPVFHEVAAKYHGRATFISVDVDDNPATARQFGVTSIPFIVILNPDSETVTYTGYMEEPEFEALVARALDH